MSYTLLLSVFLAGVTYLFFIGVLHPLFFSPLHRIPLAHPLAFTPLWIKYHRRGGSQAISVITWAHAKHGPIIRLSPSEISVASYEGAHKIYIERGGFAKPKWWAEDFETFGVTNMVSMVGGIGNKEHAQRKRDMGNVYAKSYLMHSETLRGIAWAVLQRVEKVVQDLIDRDHGVIDVFTFNGGVNADFVSAYLFGQSGATHFTQDETALKEYFHHHGTFLKGEKGEEESLAWLEKFTLTRCGKAQQYEKEDAVVHNQLHNRGIEGNDLASELLDHLIAGSEAPRIILTYLQWELCKHPDIQSRLHEEARSLLSMAVDGVPDFKALDALPLLDAVLNETLRMYMPTPGPQHRLTPPEGASIHGVWIPGNTHISASFAILQRNASVFPEPGVWKPERWLAQDKSALEEMRRWLWAFNKGSRICIGKDFSILGKSSGRSAHEHIVEFVIGIGTY